MNRVLSNQKQYSQLWKTESEFLESHGIYESLAKMTPEGNVLDFGCGIGNGVRHLSNNHSVLSLDSNEHLIDETVKRLSENGVSAKIRKCDFFNLIEEDKKIISDFQARVITGWFIGSNGMDIFKHTAEESDEATKSKLYREKVEDIIASPDICLSSVEYIHLVNRGGLVVGFPESFYFREAKMDYDTYVFGKIGFEVFEVKNLEWPREGSEFQYGQAHNPNLAKGSTVPAITSIIARRVK